jgi:hypothetical protein
MGTWGNGTFENDTADDLLVEILDEHGPPSIVRQALEVVCGAGPSEYLDAGSAEQGLAAAELVAAAAGRPSADIVEAADHWARTRLEPCPDLLDLAARSARRILGTRSELRELWCDEDTAARDRAAWLRNVEDLRTRLAAACTSDERPPPRRRWEREPELSPGDVIEIPTACGLAYAQFVQLDRVSHGHVVRVLPGFFESRPDDVAALVEGPERFWGVVDLFHGPESLDWTFLSGHAPPRGRRRRWGWEGNVGPDGLLQAVEAAGLDATAGFELGLLPAPGPLSRRHRALVVLSEAARCDPPLAWEQVSADLHRGGWAADGDHYALCVWRDGRALVWGFDHESPYSALVREDGASEWPGMFDGAPPELLGVIDDAPGARQAVTFCFWFVDGAWRQGRPEPPAPDLVRSDPHGVAHLLGPLVDDEACLDEVLDWYDRDDLEDACLDLLHAVSDDRPLTRVELEPFATVALDTDALLRRAHEVGLAVAR